MDNIFDKERAERGKLTCSQCDELATYWDDPPPKTPSAGDFWCEKHCPAQPYEGYVRLKMKQELIDLEECYGDFGGGKIWYPSFFIDNEWIGWPLKRVVYPLEKNTEKIKYNFLENMWDKFVSWWRNE